MAKTRETFMWNSRRFIFDGLFFTYTLGLLGYGILRVLNVPADQDLAVQHMRELTIAFGLTLLLCLALTAVCARLQIATLGDFLFAPPPRKRVIAARPFLKSFWSLHLLLAFALTLIVSLQMTDFSWTELTDPQGIAGAMRLYHGLTHANLDILPIAIVQIVETIFIAFLATVIALPFAFALSFLSAKNIMTHPAAFALYAVLRTLFNIARSVEPLIWALIFTVWVGVGPFAGMLALMIHSVASLAKQFSEIVEDIAEGPVEAIRATGANPIQVVWFAVVPQILLPYIAFTIYRWDTNVRMATVIGLVGGGGIGTLLLRYQGQAMWPEVGCIIFVIAVAVWIMDVASAYLREALR
jgi:phosphonate transport system permease protein